MAIIGDWVMTYGDPIRELYPLGRARLHKPINIQDSIELWLVEYPDDEGHYYERFIKNMGVKNGKSIAQ